MIAPLRHTDDPPRIPGLSGNELILGMPSEPARNLGFGPAAFPPIDLPPFITYAFSAHLLSCAPTRAGKGVSVVIPNLLNWRGSAVVFDPKGEAYMVTHRRRRKFGPVYRLDPFGVIDSTSDSMNPIDVSKLNGADIEIDSQTLAELLARGLGTKEPFWDTWGVSVNSGVIGAAAVHEDPSKRNLAQVMEMLMADDVTYNLAVLLDTVGKKLPKAAYRDIASLLQLPEVTRGGALATAQSFISVFSSERVCRTLRETSFSFQDFIDGKPMTIYLIIPPSRISMFRSLLKLWVGTLMMCVFSRTHAPSPSTLFLLDELAALETFPPLEAMMTLGAGYGAQVWGIIQDLAQLQTWYPKSWRTIVNNCAVIQAFGFNNRAMATQWSELLDHSPQELRQLT